MKIPSRKKIYGAITIISAVIGVLGGAVQVYAFFEERAEEERERRAEERRRAEEARMSETDKLRQQITFAKSFVPKCEYPKLASINASFMLDTALDRAEMELILNENMTVSRMLYESVAQLVNDYCVFEVSQAPADNQNNPIEIPIQYLIVPIFVPLAGVFGFLWYRTTKRESQERPSR